MHGVSKEDFTSKITKEIRRRSMVGRVPAIQLGGPGSIPGWVRNFYFYPGIGVSFVLYRVVRSVVYYGDCGCGFSVYFEVMCII